MATPGANPSIPSEDMYSDGPDSAPEAAPEAEEPEGGETALLPSSLCPGMKPGDEINLRIVRVHDDQYEVSYDQNETPEAEAEEAPAPNGGGEMSDMME